MDKNDWVYGYYVFQKKCSVVHGQQISELDRDKHIIVDFRGSSHEVIFESVSRCVGLKDINNKYIFENDIIKHFNECPVKELSEDIGKVFYYQSKCRFLRTSKVFPDDCPELHSDLNYEIVGNAFDDLDML